MGGMIVSGANGFEKNSYRKFNIQSEEAAGDDYAMMREVLTRSFTRALKEDPDRGRLSRTKALPPLQTDKHSRRDSYTGALPGAVRRSAAT